MMPLYLPAGGLFSLEERRIAGLVCDADGDLRGMLQALWGGGRE
jgi:hypothetical protein